MLYHAPSACPVCGQTLEVTRLRCRHCGSELTGQFAPCRFCLLEDKQLQFVETFLRCKGSIKEVEKALGVSYPTVRNMLESALKALELGEKDNVSPAQNLREAAKQDILDRLSRGELVAEEAIAAISEITNKK
ncbi:MAG: DUF2089 domain-containing protein [Clostridiales bacterium]|nr:DUF2089 domain-containing protein [Clostridiales bacterium]